MLGDAKVYWLTGLSGAGKTTIGKELYAYLKAKEPTVVFLDGDTLRDVFNGAFGYSIEQRQKCAMCYSRLCKLLAEQGINVICCTISMFDSIRDWNRANIPGYLEVYIKVSLQTLKERDQKGLYSGYHEGTVSDLMGIDITMEEPKTPDVVIENECGLSVMECVNKIINRESGDCRSE